MQYKIVVDKQSRTNPSAEKREYIVDIEELRQKGDVKDSLIIEGNRTYVTRKLSLSKYGVLSVLSTPKTEEVNDVNIELFEGDNYIYLVDMVGNKFYAEYVIKNKITDGFPTKVEMNTAISQTANQIELNVNQKLTEYSTTVEMNAAINVKANEITSTVSKGYATKNELTAAKSEIKQTTDNISTEVSKKVDEQEFGTLISQNVYNVRIAWNNNTNCVQFEGNGLTLYDGEVSENAKRAVFDFNGNNFYRDSYYVGSIRTNSWSQNSSHKGLVFDLNYQGKYMAWTERINETGDFMTKLCYSRANSIYTDEGLHLGCNLYGHWFTLNDFNIGQIAAGGYAGFTGAIPIVTEIVTDNGNYSYHYHSLLQIRNGIVVGYWED